MAKRRRSEGERLPLDETNDLVAVLQRRVAPLGESLKLLKAPDSASDASTRANALRNAREAIESLIELTDQLTAEERRESDRSERQLLELENDLRSGCRDNGWRLDGQWPNFYVEKAIGVVIDPSKRMVFIAQQRLKSCTANAIIVTLRPAVQQLIPKKFSAERFIAQLAAAYDDIRSETRQIPIWTVYRALVISSQSVQFWRDARSEAFVELTTSQFRARLSAALEKGATRSPDGRELRLLPPLNANDGLFMYQPADARFGFVGRIEFVPRPGEA
jgi:hypothetical protein